MKTIYWTAEKKIFFLPTLFSKYALTGIPKIGHISLGVGSEEKIRVSEVRMLEEQILADRTTIVRIGLKFEWSRVRIRPRSELLKSEQP